MITSERFSLPTRFLQQIHNYHIRDLIGALGIISETMRLRPEEIKGMPGIAPEGHLFGCHCNAFCMIRITYTLKGRKLFLDDHTNRGHLQSKYY